MKELREVSRNDAGSNRDPAHAALQEGAALVERTGRGLLRLTGKDPVGMLNAILTNSVPQNAHLGVYALLLNPKGRVQSDLRVLKFGEDILVDTEPEGADAAREILGRYAPFSRVKLEDLWEGWSVLGLYGPGADDLLEGLDLAEHQTTEVEIGGGTLLIAGVAAPVPGYDLLGPSETVARARESLIELGGIPANLDAYETARIEAGVPRMGAELDDSVIPAEAGVVERAVSFTKGCYPGQEPVARLHHRGHANRGLRVLELEGSSVPEYDAEVRLGEKVVGRVTSAVREGDGVVALAYVRVEVPDDAELTVGGTRARVAPLSSAAPRP